VAGGGDREFLLSVFLMEAWDTLATVEQRLGEPVTEAGLDELRVVTHRLRGSSALNGFPQVSALAAEMESVVERLAAATGDAVDRERAALAGLAAALHRALDAIGATGREDGPAIVDALRGAPAEPRAPAVGGAPTPLDELDAWLAASADVLEYFLPEATEHLDAMAGSLAALERGAGEDEVARLFRAVHTLKGAAYTVGCRVVGALAHRVEDLLGEIRDGQRGLDAAALEAVSAGHEALRLLVGGAGAPGDRDAAYARACGLLDAVVRGAAAPAGPAPAAAAEPTAAPSPAQPGFRPAVAAAQAARAAAQTPPAAAVRPSIRVTLDRLDALMNLVGELVIARGRLDRRLVQLEKLGELLLFTQERMRSTVGEFEGKYANPHLPSGAHAAGDGGANGHAEPLAVPLDEVFGELEFDRYDDFSILARRVGEIAADVAEAQAQLAALVRAVREDAARVQQLSAAMRSEVTRARMVPLGRLFARFSRQARETARTAGKLVALEVSGDAVEVDNAILDHVTDPLLHLVQNAIVHGIETEEERRAAGKPPQGTIRLSASHKGGTLVLEVADDGRGIDVAAVRAAAVRGGFAGEAEIARLGDRDVVDFIFQPGFSTATTVTTAAGRGVGMDVVRTNVGRLGGEIDVETAAGAGTTFTLKLPLTLAVSDALFLRIGAERFAVPVQAVKAMTRIRRDEVDEDVVTVEGEPLPLVRLDRALGLEAGGAAGVVNVVVLRTGRRAVAVTAAELLGKQEIVVKRLGAFLDDVGPFSGATVTAEGRVVLLLDPARLAERHAAPVPVRAAAAEPAATPGGARARTVLLVDDSISVRRFVGQMLERAGFRVVAANDGIEALARLNEVSVDAIVTDLEMPRLNGYELIRDLRRRPGMRDIPVAVLTTRAGEKHVRLARQLGVEHYVTKPVDEQSFVRLVETLVGEAAAVSG